jgi:ABC-type Zn uptake system ZnuABC Zn-binding protein ZnuA
MDKMDSMDRMDRMDKMVWQQEWTQGWKRGIKGWVSAGVAMALVACSAPPAAQPPAAATAATAATTAPATRLKAVATFSMVADWVRNVAGDNIDLTTYVGAGADVHDFEPTPSDVAKLSEASLIFEVGAGLESWLDNLVRSSGTQATRVVLSEGLTLREAGEEAHGHEGEAGATKTADDHSHGEYDPHVWQDPKNVMTMVGAIRDALVAADPANAAVYRQNAERYLAQLDEMDNAVRGTLEQLPPAQRKLVTSHDALGYFAAHYGFEVVGNVIASLSTEAGEPSAQDLAALIDGIKAEGVKAIFLESMANPKLVERVASEAGVAIGPELYTDALGPAGSAGATYIDAMQFNAKAIVDALK